jgi:multidrug transporter EmrE-like cation transporter
MTKLILFLSCIIAVIADMALVWWAKQPDHPIMALVLGIVLNLCGLMVWAYSMRKGIESAMAITVYALFTVAACSLLGFLIFKEPLSFTNSIGLGLALIALIMISL